jgi:predicted HTH domain antitoxin
MYRTLSQEVTMRISIDVPEEYVLDQGPAEIARRLKLNAALLMFQAGEISAGGAAQLAGADRFTFAAECKRHGIPLVDYDPDELRDELAMAEPA